jgi:hypothetical protein
MSTGKLTDTAVLNAKFPGKSKKYADGGGMYLLVSEISKY